MGRTIRPVRYEADYQLDELRRYVKALRRADKDKFERLYADVKKHISSISYANPLNPSELMQWSAILELEKKIEELKKRLDRLKG